MTARTLRLTCLFLAAALLAACASTTQRGTVGGDRRQLLLISSEELERMAEKSYAQATAEARKKGALNRDPALTARVRGIADRLIPQSVVFRPDAKAWKWEVNVEQSDQLNAYCMPGGKIMVYSGLVRKLELSDAEIAAVVGHEIAHALREHTRERASQAVAAQVGISVGAAVLGVGSAAADLASIGYQVFVETAFSRSHETEADRIGLELAARAGYDPRAAVTLWQKMTSSGGGRPPEFLSTHPAGETRVRDIERLLPTVMPLYEAAPKAR